MKKDWISGWDDTFSIIKDPRIERTKKHMLRDILLISLCAVISGCDNWVEVVAYAKIKKEWFSTFLDLPNGIPSHDTFTRVFRNIDSELFQKCFLEWVCETAVHIS